MSVILNEVFKMVFESSQLRNDGCNFSRFNYNSISDIMEKIHVKLTNCHDKEPEQIRSNYRELDRILDVIILIWDDHCMSHSKVPSTYNDRYTYEEKPKDRSIFERIIRQIINGLFSSIDAFIDRLYRNGCDLYNEIYSVNRQLIHSVLKIALRLPLEEMFEVSQARPDLPLHLRIQHDADRFIKVYIWIILILLKNGPQFNFEPVHSDEFCSICCDESKKDFVKIIDGCVHSYCKSCYSEALKLSKKCPGCRQEYKPIDISELCTQSVFVFLEERQRRNEAFIRLETDEKQILIQFLVKRSFDLTTINTDISVRCFSGCGNLYTNAWKGTHKCGPSGNSHHATKHIGMASLSVLRSTDCCLNCEGTFYAYKECGHIVCEAHIEPSNSDRGVCHKCSTNTFKIKLNF